MAAVALPVASPPGGYYMGSVRVKGAAGGPLQGLNVVVKDCYAIKGHRTSNGSPTWLETHPPAAETAAAVQALLDVGCTVSGKCIMDELAYSLGGDNSHYGTPRNPACPDHLPGGSSSGTAAAVAAGDAELGLGGDTGGSVRVPASYCGILGIRPTHGRVSLAGSCPLAPSFDTAGWFARDAGLLCGAGAVLLDPASRADVALRRWLLARDAFELAEPATAAVLRGLLAARETAVTRLVGPAEEVEVAAVEGGLNSWRDVFRIHQAYEIWQGLGPWVQQHRPPLGPGVKERFEMASQITAEEFEGTVRRRAAVAAHLDQLLGNNAVLVMPTCPGPAPRLDSSPAAIDAMRAKLLSLTCIAGLGGLPQVSLPLATVDGCPVGLSLLGPRGSDEALLLLSEQLMAALRPGYCGAA